MEAVNEFVPTFYDIADIFQHIFEFVQQKKSALIVTSSVSSAKTRSYIGQNRPYIAR